MRKLAPIHWQRFYALRHKYPELTQSVYVERFGISLDTVKAHWWDHRRVTEPSGSPVPPARQQHVR